jgi:beta-glucosidase
LNPGDGHKYKSDYLDVSNEPLYPFGYGLSYTSFSYGDIHLSKANIAGNEGLTATVTVTNSGNYDGEEVVQLYLHDKIRKYHPAGKAIKGVSKNIFEERREQGRGFQYHAQ